MVSVAIFDYGAGNIFSLKNSLEQAGASVDVITTFDKPNIYSGLLLPGVGNFDPAIKVLMKILKLNFKILLKLILLFWVYVLEWKCFLKKVKKELKKDLM